MEDICYLKSGSIDQTYRDEADQLKKHKQNPYENELGSRTLLIKLRNGRIMSQTYREGIEGWLEGVPGLYKGLIDRISASRMIENLKKYKKYQI